MGDREDAGAVDRADSNMGSRQPAESAQPMDAQPMDTEQRTEQPTEQLTEQLAGQPTDAAVPPGEAKPRRKRWKVALAWTAAVLVVLSGGAVVAGFTLVNRYENKVERQDILPAQVRPKAPTEWSSDPLNFLVLGSDSRGEDALGSDDPGGARSDTIMIVHITADHRAAYVVSIPRDAYVDVPAVAGKWRGGKNKINTAFQFGGAKLAAETVYNLTKVPLDTAMIVDFGGIHSMVGAVGTVHVCIPFSMSSIHTKRKWAKGCHDMGPEETEDFMRQRRSVPGGDFGRIQNQQLVVKGLAEKITSEGMMTSPLRLDGLISTAAESVTVDQGTNIRDLVLALRGISPSAIRFATVPYTGTGTTDAGSSVFIDAARAEELFAALRNDTMQAWLAANPQERPTG